MPAKGQILFQSSLVGAVQSTPVTWDGGRTTLCVNAAAYSTGLQLQAQGPSGAWINVGSSIVSDQLFPFDAPPGQYRFTNTTSSSIGVNAVLVTVPYI